MTDEVRVKASISLLSAAKGGRTTPIRSGFSYRPNHNFGGPEDREMAMGLINLLSAEDLEPGGTATVEITFLNLAALNIALRPGDEWTIQEGSKIVGKGSVLEILE